MRTEAYAPFPSISPVGSYKSENIKKEKTLILRLQQQNVKDLHHTLAIVFCWQRMFIMLYIDWQLGKIYAIMFRQVKKQKHKTIKKHQLLTCPRPRLPEQSLSLQVFPKKSILPKHLQTLLKYQEHWRNYAVEAEPWKFSSYFLATYGPFNKLSVYILCSSCLGKQ